MSLMSDIAPTFVSVAFGQLRYRTVLVLLTLAVLNGWLVVSFIPFFVYAAFIHAGGALGETTRWIVGGSTSLMSLALTYRSRGWITRKAKKEATPDPVRFWSGRQIIDTSKEIVASFAEMMFGLFMLVIVLLICAVALLACYFLFEVMSVPVAILLGAIIIALAIIAACS